MLSTVNYTETDMLALERGLLSGISIDCDEPIRVRASVSFALDLLILKVWEKIGRGNLFVLFPDSDECESNAAALQDRCPDCVLLDSEGKQPDRFTAQFIQSAKDLQTGGKRALVVSTIQTACGVIPDFSDAAESLFSIRKGEVLDVSALADFLAESGYCKTPFVRNGGDFSIFGEVIDVFPVFNPNPIRIYLDFDSIEKITSYDVSTEENIDEIEGYSFARIGGESAESRPFMSLLGDDDCIVFAGMERILEFMDGANPQTGRAGDLEKWIEAHPRQVKCEFYEMADREGAIVLDGVREASAFGSFGLFKETVGKLLEAGFTIRILANSVIQIERIRTLLGINGDDGRIGFERQRIARGFYFDKGKFAVFSPEEIFNKREKANLFASVPTQSITDFTTLKIGDHIVHSQHGIGIFAGFDKIEMLGMERDYIKIEYADKEFFYVPLERANQIEKYIGNSQVRLDKLHSPSWNRRKEKALENARIFADRLLSLYARRKMSQGFCHEKDNDWQLIFEEGFENEETPDQLSAIADVKRDMESPVPMDRIICGDVGFGKTEIAFRACFKAVMSGKQVAFLSPTTILTSQHCANFRKRCASFPIVIEELSRIRSPSQAKKVIAGLVDGSVDVVFGTHRLLQRDVGFSNLGLLVIDEEQRFGVKDKERIKELKANVDTLTLTATPIPRTLYMSLMKLRDISLLMTPPKKRMATDIVIRQRSDEIVDKAISDELARGGQVFYLHNNISDIGRVKDRIAKDFPQARIGMMHGRMPSAEMESAIGDFVNGWTDVLVSTTIIENGIDVPNANTLIVDDATIYGTSQLYQIKGRVGRSSRKAVAYLLYPHNSIVNHNAIARIKAISENRSLGSGFNIAMSDLAIRGSGNILSKEQSGHAESVGLDMYMRLLDLSVKELEKSRERNPGTPLPDGRLSGDPGEEFEVSVNLPCSAFVPDSYISDTEVKFSLYKRLANAKTEDEISGILGRIEMRYGALPDPLVQLHRINLIKILCRQKKIAEISCSTGRDVLSIRYRRVKDMNADNALNLIGSMKGKASLNATRPNELLVDIKGSGDLTGKVIAIIRML